MNVPIAANWAETSGGRSRKFLSESSNTHAVGTCASNIEHPYRLSSPLTYEVKTKSIHHSYGLELIPTRSIRSIFVLWIEHKKENLNRESV